MSNDLLNLQDCTAGEMVTICSIGADLSCAQRLRELGLVEGSHVLLIKQEDPVLLLVKESRIAIDPATAKQITVSHLPDEEAAEHAPGDPLSDSGQAVSDNNLANGNRL